MFLKNTKPLKMSNVLLSDFLYNSNICRLCAEENTNGTQIFANVENGLNIAYLINRYLPIQIADDGSNSKCICPGCHIQVESTVQFFNLVIEGQSKIKLLLLEQMKQSASNSSQAINDSIIDESQLTMENLRVTKVASIFENNHEMIPLMESTTLTKPKKKRGRPKKLSVEFLEAKQRKEDEIVSAITKADDQMKELVENTESIDGRRKRKIKVPLRLQEAIKGKELEEIFTDNIKIEFNEKDEIIGHIRNSDGSNLGGLILINDNTNSSDKMNPRRMNKQKTKFLCDICNHVFLQEHRYLAHRNTHNLLLFECRECLEQFADREIFLEHQIQTNHKGEGRIESMNLQVNEVKKMPENSSTTGAVTIPCALTTTSISLLKPKEEILEIQTQESQTVDSNLNPLNIDKIKFSNDKLKCKECDRVFTHPSSLIYHNESDHNNGRRFACIKCNKVFKHKQLLQRHQVVHTTSRPFTCNLCNNSFKSKVILQNHQLIHTKEKKFECEICNKKFAHKTSLKLHFRWHNNEKPFQCGICDKKFTQNGNLQEHMRIHNGEKPYKCPICDKSFVTSSQVKLHIRRHINDKSYECEICNKPFLLQSTYLAHLRRHESYKPFVCHCKKAFADKWCLQKHQRTHTGFKPYSCNVCNKPFSDASNLKKHQRAHFPTGTDEVKITSATTGVANTSTGLWPIMNGLIDSQENDNIEYFDYADNVDKILLDDTSTTNYNATIRFDNTTMVDNPDPVLIEMTDDNPITNEPLIKCHEIVPLENTILDISKVQHIEPISAGSLLNIQNIGDENLFDDTEQQCVELITSDGQKIRFFANYDDVMQSEFLSIS